MAFIPLDVFCGSLIRSMVVMTSNLLRDIDCRNALNPSKTPIANIDNETITNNISILDSIDAMTPTIKKRSVPPAENFVRFSALTWLIVLSLFF